MNHLEHPSNELWNSRRNWFELLIFKYEEIGSYLVSEQACALISEVQSCYCAGSWVAVIVMTYAVIEAQLLEIESPDFKGNSKELLERLGFGTDFQNLRLRRNRIVHIKPDLPAITVDQQWEDREQLQKDAKYAIELMFKAFFANPSI